MTQGILDKFYQPKSIVLVGATSSPGFGYGIPLFWRTHGWQERTHLVNSKGGNLHGQEVYRSIADLPEGIDLAVVIVPSDKVRDVLVDLGKKGIRAVIIESAGFAEIGEEGRKRQDEVLEIARQYGLRLLGPNCVGIVNTENRLATVEILETSMKPGSVAILAQSGIFGNILLEHLPEAGIKISKVATLGNKIDLDEADFLEYFVDDPQTKVILIYEEGARDGRRLLDALRRTAHKKPVIVLKSGRTPLGRQATLSHTGSLSGEDGVYEAAFRQAGAIRASSISEMVDIARVFSSQPLMKDKKIGILTTSGSLGAMAADALFLEGLELASWSQTTFEKIRGAAPGWVNVKNPLDVGPSGVFPLASNTIISDPNPDAFILIPVVPSAAIQSRRQMGVKTETFLGDWQSLREKAGGKPILTVSLGCQEWLDQIKEFCGEAIALVSTPEGAAKALSALYRFSKNFENQ